MEYLGVVVVKQPASRFLVGDYLSRQATFSDPALDDVLPVPSDSGTTSSVSGKTFQVAPLPQDCDRTIPQGSFSSGLIVSMMDGSVRIRSGSVATNILERPLRAVAKLR